jgi:hypothetical protein
LETYCYCLLIIILLFLLVLVILLSFVHHELVHGRSQELQDRISWNLKFWKRRIAPLMVTYHYVKMYVSIIIQLEVMNINVWNFKFPIGFFIIISCLFTTTCAIVAYHQYWMLELFRQCAIYFFILL